MIDTDSLTYSLAPSALIAGRDAAVIRAEVEASGYRVLWSGPLAELPTGATLPLADVFIFDMGDAEDDADLDMADDLMADGEQLVIRYDDAGFERVADRWGGSSALLLCDAAPGELAGALTLMRHARTDRLQDSAATPDTVRLQLLADQVSRIARTLAEMTEAEPALGRRGGLRSPTDDFTATSRAMATDAPVTAKAVRAVIAERRLRDRFFDPELFGEPAWDMLLDLYAARLEHARVSVSSVCIAAAVPSTTALRWLKTLTDIELVKRRADPHDKRRVFIELGEEAAARAERLFHRAGRRLTGLRPDARWGRAPAAGA